MAQLPTPEELRARHQQNQAKVAATSKWAKVVKSILAGFVALIVVLFFVLKDDPKPAAKNYEKMAVMVAQLKVKSQLKSPSTADFEMFSGQVADKGNGLFVVRDHVDSQNSFGATVRSEYLVELQFNGGDQADPNSWTVNNLTIQ